MRIVVAPFGSRGDFQPLLALSVALQRAGHDVTLTTTRTFAAEASAFGVSADVSAFDVEAYVREATASGGAFGAMSKLARPETVRRFLSEHLDSALRLYRGADLIVGGGAQPIAPTVAEKLGIPYLHVAPTPQLFPSRHHPPVGVPWPGLPGWANRSMWWVYRRVLRLVVGGPIDQMRRQLGLAPVSDLVDFFSPRAASVVAADPELAVVPEDVRLARPLTGALHLADERPLPDALEAFLDAGTTPVYVGFGSMGDPHPARTSRLLVDGVRATGQRLILSSGWARLGDPAAPRDGQADDVLVVGPISHRRLFPRVAAVVHHGGAGTTAAALRAGRPQLVVPHLFDQFQWGQWVARAGLGPPPIPKRRLTAGRLSGALTELLREPRYASRAEALGLRVRERDPAAQCLALAEEVVWRARHAGHPTTSASSRR